MRAVLITGGAGFIGSEFVRQTIAAGGVQAVVLDALTYAGNRSNLVACEGDARFRFVEGSIGDRDLVAWLLAEHRVQGVVNLAAETHVDRSIGSPLPFVRTNVLDTCQLLDTTLAYWRDLTDGERQAFRFLHASTDEVYGELGETGSFSEETPYAPNSLYAASKASSDHFVRAYEHTYGLPTLITNCSNNYGPHQFPEKLIPLMIARAMRGESLPVYGAGANVRDWLHVSDHCRALRAVLDRGRVGKTYNIGGGAEKTNIEVVHEICRQVEGLRLEVSRGPLTELIEFVTDRPGHDFRYAIDATKIRDELGWAPDIDFAEGIAATVKWYAANQAWVEATRQRTRYRGERLGLNRQTSPSRDVPTTKNGAAPADDDAIAGVMIRPVTRHSDRRGWLIELYRDDELPEGFRPQMAYLSETNPGVARGPHEHAEQSDYFLFLGPGDYHLHIWDARDDSPTTGAHLVRLVGESFPCAVLIPPGVVHAYENTGDRPAQVINAPDRLYAGWGRQDPVDEIRHEDDPTSPYELGGPKPQGNPA